MKKYFYIAGALLLVFVVVLGFRFAGNNSKAAGTRVAKVDRGPIDAKVGARGRVEGISEEIKVTSKLAGRLKEVRVEEGQHIQQGDVIAVLENDDYLARVHAVEAAVKQAEARLERVLNGARREERDEARAAMEEAKAVAENARATYTRWKKLYEESGIISKEKVEEQERNLKTAEARHESLRQRFLLIDAPPRPEDVALARSELAAARAQLEEARVSYENTFVRAPIGGVILKKFLKPGESIIAFDRSSAPVVTMTDDSRLIVRAEIDETDISKIAVGQRARITADAYGRQPFYGTVKRIGNSIGKKNVRTDDPTEKVDTEVLETLVELDPSAKIQIGLRVDVWIEIVHREQVLRVPRVAVSTFHPDHRDFTRETFVLARSNGATEKRSVRIGACDGLHCEVISGLQEGETVVY